MRKAGESRYACFPFDFENAFDRIAYNNLFQTLQGYGIGNAFIASIKRMYEGATSSVQTNGHKYGPVPIRCAVRQGYPMSMVLYALCLHTLLRLLDIKLPGIRIGRRTRPTSVVAYTDDVTIFVASAADFAIIEEAIRLYERASGARLKPRKSKALAVGSWCTQQTVLGITYHPHVTILGVTFWGTIEQTKKGSWARLTGKVRAQAKRVYTRGPCLATRMRYVSTFLLSKIWYTAQILPVPNIHTQQLTTVITLYIWRVTDFRVPVSTIQRLRQMGGWEMPDNEAKCTALLLYRMYLQDQRNGTVTAAWLQTWNLTGRQGNPPHATKFPTKLA